jgi:hypothetical protein
MQSVITYLVIALAVGYAAWRAYLVFRRANDPCYGCSGCALKDVQRAACKKNADCCHKK